MKRFDIKVYGTYIEDERHRIYDDNGQYADGNIASDLYDALHCLTEEVKKMKADIKNHPKMLGHLFEADAALEKSRGKS